MLIPSAVTSTTSSWPVAESGFNERIARDNLDGNDAASSHIGEVTERRLFDRAGARGEEDHRSCFQVRSSLLSPHSFLG